jgi:hypothetical protein
MPSKRRSYTIWYRDVLRFVRDRAHRPHAAHGDRRDRHGDDDRGAPAIDAVSTDVAVMAALALAFIVPAVWMFGRQE